jgi:hypothetical protein
MMDRRDDDDDRDDEGDRDVETEIASRLFSRLVVRVSHVRSFDHCHPNADTCPVDPDGPADHFEATFVIGSATSLPSTSSWPAGSDAAYRDDLYEAGQASALDRALEQPLHIQLALSCKTRKLRIRCAYLLSGREGVP